MLTNRSRIDVTEDKDENDISVLSFHVKKREIKRRKNKNLAQKDTELGLHQNIVPENQHSFPNTENSLLFTKKNGFSTQKINLNLALHSKIWKKKIINQINNKSTPEHDPADVQ
jgi:hypothetical protein